MTSPYLPKRAARSLWFPLRGLRHHALLWGDLQQVTPDRPLRVLMHGWMDLGASFQFVVDGLDPVRPVLAADWRGFGQTAAPAADAYWFPDYLGDLDALLDAVSPELPVDLLGHSMGGNVVMAYAGVRPQRVRRLINLEGFGLPDVPADDAPARLVRWLDELKAPAMLRDYDSAAAVAERLRKSNPRLSPEHAEWLATHWAAPAADGRWQLRADAAHKRINPVPYRAAEAVAMWRRIAAPVLWVEGRETRIASAWAGRYPRAEFDARLAVVPTLERAVIDDAGHMLHHDQPEALAAVIEKFWRA
ncbi:alpha/beta fold hydrolase [Aquincola sp. S2]|uniref:Alpha/beta fold hydrolase n=1 Tax=Pseudaquabacterium terrae TaxID=2732868 RepID=A0ABX2EG84_9BURK|nr:alpha/beta fold hydrolase [Aquabacterium terrae]NRF67628.1 alpha/beta fold hydrolase [Aquabacterium terrae]